MPLIIMSGGRIGLSTRIRQCIEPFSAWAASYQRLSWVGFIIDTPAFRFSAQTGVIKRDDLTGSRFVTAHAAAMSAIGTFRPIVRRGQMSVVEVRADIT